MVISCLKRYFYVVLVVIRMYFVPWANPKDAFIVKMEDFISSEMSYPKRVCLLYSEICCRIHFDKIGDNGKCCILNCCYTKLVFYEFTHNIRNPLLVFLSTSGLINQSKFFENHFVKFLWNRRNVIRNFRLPIHPNDWSPSL